ncbi:tail fiber protein [Brucella sp. BE17]|uniref:phage tail protein n=1 Tax=Brucella sp. BE17 TaxID=3142977 RepID=UPI0031BB8EAF
MDAYLTTILPIAFDWAPQGWLQCNGQSLPVSQSEAVFALIGSRYGGDGRTNFNIPDLRGTFPIGYGQRPSGVNYPIASKGGNDVIQLTQNQLPAHAHVATFTPTGTATFNIPAQSGSQTATLKANGTAGTLQNPTTGSVLAGGGSASVRFYGTAASDQVDLHNSSVTLSGDAPTAAQTVQTNAITGGNVSVGVTGASAPIDARPPYLAINFIFCIAGIYPYRP